MRFYGRKNSEIQGKQITLYLSGNERSPLIILNNFYGDGSNVCKELEKMDLEEFHLASIGNLKWNHDMTPWYCDPLSPGDEPCTGGADEYLRLLTERMIPDICKENELTPSYIGIAGYSLAGLFAVYAMYRTDVFNRVASMSGSLWFPGFVDYAKSNRMERIPDKMYLSLGSKEAITRNPVLKTVQANTETLFEFYRQAGVDITFEQNEGNHYQDADLRSAKGIAAML